MRVTGGRLCGRSLRTLPGLDTRPPLARVRQAVFNVLGTAVLGAHLLDLYAGTGSYSIEALSRGAARATLVERSPAALAVLRANLESTGCREWAEVIRGDVLAVLTRLGRERRSYDLVAVAPPHAAGLCGPTLQALDRGGLVAAGGVVWVQHQAGEPLAEDYGELARRRSSRYGSTLVSWFGHRGV